MKRLSIILFLLISIHLKATIYYCSPTGSDASADPTNIATPWASWHYAFNNVTPSDTVYFRGGIYSAYSSTIGVRLTDTGSDGTHDKPTCFFAYPSDYAVGNYPIMDCQNMTNTDYQLGIFLRGCNNLHLKGLTVRNLRQSISSTEVHGFIASLWTSAITEAPNNIIFENCIAYNIGMYGFSAGGADTVYFINCDAYNCCDSLTNYDPGGSGTGFNASNGNLPYENALSSYTYYKGCRAWQCSDQGWALTSAGTVVIDSCWAINNGNMPFEGNVQTKGSGFKLWYAYDRYVDHAKTQVIMHNSIATYNEFIGINLSDYNHAESPELRSHIYNNFIYNNGLDAGKSNQWGFGLMDAGAHSDTTGRWDHWYWNNISYNNYNDHFWSSPNGDVLAGVFHQATNKWDIAGTTISNLDFVSLDTTGLCGPRQSDGSLPITTFGHLAATSECINAGTDVGLPYEYAPDIGWVEYTEGEPVTDALNSTITPYNISIKQATAGGTVTSDGGGIITARGVCWGTSANPDLTDNVITVSGTTGSFTTIITGLSSNTTYYVQSYATNEIGTAYGGNISFTTPEWAPAKSGSAYVFSNGHIIKIK